MTSLRILLVGGGGREHALAWKLSQSPLVSQIFAIPGNGGTASLSKVSNVSSVSPESFSALLEFARRNDVNFLVPGPEQPLVDGVVDYFRVHAHDIRCFGPSEDAARMEGSKTYAKDFMRRHQIPTAAYQNFSDYEQARQYLDTVSHDVVIKASGLAAGKGVVIPQTKQQAHDTLKDIMLNKEFGSAGDEVVIEEFLEGEEISILSFCDGNTIKSLPPAQDHKRIGEGDTGPNTGGMGTYAPTKVASETDLEEIHKTILQPTVDGMREEGYPMTGCLFTGLMMTKRGPRVLEYNVRFGDPESQSLLPLMESDLAEAMLACTDGKLNSFELRVSSKFAATVVMAAGGYPGSYKKGVPIELDPVPKDIVLFHAGTALDSDALKTSGGRVIASTATGETLEDAVRQAYCGVECVEFEGMQYRKDIARRALNGQHG